MGKLLRNPNYVLLWTGGFITQMGDWLLEIGLPIAVFLLTGSALVTSTVFIVEFLPPMLFGSFAGVLVDRWDRRMTLIIGSSLQALILLPLLLVHSAADLGIVYGVSVAEAFLTLVTTPAVGALLPRLVEEDQVLQANSFGSLSAALARLLGAPLGGVVVGLLGLPGVVLLDAASFILAGVLILAMRVTRQQTRAVRSEGDAAHPAIWREWRDGLRVIARNPRLITLFIVGGLQSLAQGIFLILYIVFVLRVLHGTATDVGLLRGVQAIGGLLGGLFIAAVGQRFRLSRLIGISTIAFGLIDLAIWDAPLVYPSLVLTTVLFILVGIPSAGTGSGMMSFLQLEVADEYRGRVLATFSTVGSLLMVVGLGLAGALSDQVNVLFVLNGQGAVYLLAGFIALLGLGVPVAIAKPVSVELSE
jgi:MFS family permease